MSEEIQNEKKSNGLLIGLVIGLFLSLGAMAYFWSQKNKALNECSNTNAQLEADMAGMNQMMEGYVGNLSNDLKQDFKNMLKTYDALIAKDASKADSLNIQKEKIQSLINELSTNKKRSARELFNMKKENETLRNIMKGYVRTIDSLNTMNVELKTNLETTSSELSSTISQRDEYKTQAEQNAEQVKKGSKLQAYNFRSVGLRMKLNNTTEETNKAKSCIQMKSSFTIGENAIARAGRKSVYLQITNPDGKILQGRSSNTAQMDGGSISYSDKKEIDYNNSSIDVTIYYDLNGEEAVKGNYRVKIFCDGQQIGSDSFSLK
jgi:hypothetical protein